MNACIALWRKVPCAGAFRPSALLASMGAYCKQKKLDKQGRILLMLSSLRDRVLDGAHFYVAFVFL